MKWLDNLWLRWVGNEMPPTLNKRKYVARALNKLLWKLPKYNPGCWKTTDEAGRYIVAELRDVKIKIAWDGKNERFY